MLPRKLTRFLFPTLDRRFFLRLSLLIAGTFLVCRFWLVPARIEGISMLPTYPERGFAFCNRLAYRNKPPAYGDVVALRYGGARHLLLKRVIGLEGDTIEFRSGTLFRNNRPVDEPYVVLPCDWSTPPRTVSPNHIYVMGDNRSIPFSAHAGGEIDSRRIFGRPL